MTTPSNYKFYEWGYHNPPDDPKNPILPLTDEQRKIFERIIQTTGDPFYVGQPLLASGEGLNDSGVPYNIGYDSSEEHYSAPALYPYDPGDTGLKINKGAYYWSSGTMTVWPSPSGSDEDEERYSAYWWDASGLYFAPSVYGEAYYSYPLVDTENAATIFLFDDLDHSYWQNTGSGQYNNNRKYLLWINGDHQVDQFGIFHFGRYKTKTVSVPLGYDSVNNRSIYKKEDRPYYYSHFSNADHDKVNGGVASFELFTTYIHYIPRMINEFQLTHEKVVNRTDRLNEIPFLANTKSVYLYSVYGSDNTFIPVLRTPRSPFPPVARPDGNEESKEQSYYGKDVLDSKFASVSGLLGL